MGSHESHKDRVWTSIQSDICFKQALFSQNVIREKLLILTAQQQSLFLSKSQKSNIKTSKTQTKYAVQQKFQKMDVSSDPFRRILLLIGLFKLRGSVLTTRAQLVHTDLYLSEIFMTSQLNSTSATIIRHINQLKMQTQAICHIMREHLPSLKDKDIVVKKLSGLTNVTSAVYVNQEPLFIFKTFSDGFDREMENRIVSALSDRDMCPRIIYADQHIRIEQFLSNTQHPTNEQLTDPILQKRIIEHMFLFHQVPLVSPRPTLAGHLFSAEQQAGLRGQRKNKSKSGGNQELFFSLFDKVTAMLQQRQALREKLLPQDDSSIRLCHNDLNNLNILFTSERMHFIDYDYVGSNYLAYDIANFIAESTIDYSAPSYPGFTITKYYTVEEINVLARMYPGYYPGLEVEVRQMLCVSCLYWAVWSIYRFSLNTCETFGVAEHGLMRLQLFDYYYSLLSKQ